jgi:hypothetical protein
MAENGIVLREEKAAVAALKMVNNVFNFFLSCLKVKPKGKSFSYSLVLLLLLLNAKLNDKVFYLPTIADKN